MPIFGVIPVKTFGSLVAPDHLTMMLMVTMILVSENVLKVDVYISVFIWISP